jgi:GPH family glycoside/pentoside/hexuronide:cation symporter
MARSDPADKDKLPLSVALGWGMGTLNIAILFNSKNVLLLKFLTDHLGIAAAVAGGLMAIAKIFDAITDPLMGMLSDRTNTRIGRRRPYLLVGTLMCAASMLILFAPPSWAIGSEAYVLFGLLWYSAAYTVFNVPYLAMPAEMTSRYHERSFLMSFRVAGISLGQLLAIGVGPIIVASFGGGMDGHAALAWVLAGFALAAGLICYKATAKARFTPRNSERYSITEQFAAVVRNRPFALLLGAKFFVLMGVSFFQSAIAFFVANILGLGYASLGLLIGAMTVAGLIALPIWLRVSRLIDKRQTAIWSIFFYALISASWFLASASDPIWMHYLRGALMGAASTGLTLMLQSLLPDTIAADRGRTGENREGIYAGVYTFAEKIAYAVGTAFTGLFFGFMGYVASAGPATVQPDSAILAIALSASIIPGFLFLVSILFLLVYRLDEAALARLAAARAGEAQANGAS